MYFISKPSKWYTFMCVNDQMIHSYVVPPINDHEMSFENRPYAHSSSKSCTRWTARGRTRCRTISPHCPLCPSWTVLETITRTVFFSSSFWIQSKIKIIIFSRIDWKSQKKYFLYQKSRVTISGRVPNIRAILVANGNKYHIDNDCMHNGSPKEFSSKMDLRGPWQKNAISNRHC